MFLAQKMMKNHYTWDELKAQEKKNIQNSVLDGVSKSLPALMAAYKLQEKAAKTRI